MSPLQPTASGRLRLSLKVIPNSRREGLDGVHAGRLQIRLAAPAVDGKANAALVSFLARLLGLKKTQVALAQGQTTRQKVLEIEGCELAEAQAKLGL